MISHMMIDLETLDTLPTAVILSIGAIRFDPYSGHLDAGFYTTVDAASCQDHGLTIGAATVRWWFDQGNHARSVIHSDVRLAMALSELSWYYRSSPVAAVWSHGPSFDLVVLENAFRAVGLATPWSHRDQRCTRTIYDLAGVKLSDHQSGVAHQALEDARGQALAVVAAYRALGFDQFGKKIGNLVIPGAEEERRV